MLASGNAYRVPVYTILGNHDWRINPYPPFTKVGAPGPRLFIHDHAKHSVADQRKILETAHGPGHEIMFSYDKKVENRFVEALKTVGTVMKTLGSLITQTRTMDVEGFPAETTVESVAWYLFVINPFFDYDVHLPSRHQLLMLDWAKDEDVLFPIIAKGQEWPYMLWQLGSAAHPGPKARRCLTSVQQHMVREFIGAPGSSKIIGVHAAPIGPYPDWSEHDMYRGRKTFDRPADARGPTNYATKRPDGTIEKWNGHPIFAIRPRSGDIGHGHGLRILRAGSRVVHQGSLEPASRSTRSLLRSQSSQRAVRRSRRSTIGREAARRRAARQAGPARRRSRRPSTGGFEDTRRNEGSTVRQYDQWWSTREQPLASAHGGRTQDSGTEH